MADAFYQVQPYEIPAWAAQLNNVPQHKVKLSSLNTPIHKWNIPGIPSQFSVSIKRDDLTGCELSGNKVRCLELIFADVIKKGCHHVVTGGGPQSGHCRAVAMAARALGITPHICVEGVEKEEELGTSGNALLSRLTGSNMFLTPYKGIRHFQQRVRTMADYISTKLSEPCYCIPVGGTSPVGLFGFISLFEELLSQGLLENFDDIVTTIATGGTTLGLAVGNYFTGSKLRIHAISISLTKDLLYEDCNRVLREVGFPSDVPAEELFHIVEEHIGEGYGKTTNEGLDFIADVCSHSGVLLDPVYTGKAAKGLVQELNSNPGQFHGNRILFIHTGGIFGLFTGQMDRVLTLPGIAGNKVTPWPDLHVSPI